MVTLKELAQRLGVSTATVSRSLNDQPGVSQATRQRVLQLVSELNYVPNVAARGLATDHTHTIAFLTAHRSLPFSADPFYLHIMRGAEEELARHGYYLIVSTLNGDMPMDAGEFRLLREKRVDGFILAGPDLPPRFVLSLKTAGARVLLVDNTLPQSPVDCVLGEDEQGGYDATRHLLDHGHRLIVALSGPTGWPSNRARCEGYRRAMQEADLPSYGCHQLETTIQTGYAAMTEALDRHPALTAIFAVNDSMAIGAMRAAGERGRSVPDDLAVVGFDDIEWAAHSEPPLTTIKVHKRQMGAIAARRLIEIIERDENVPVRSTVATNLVVRASCGCQTAAPHRSGKEG